MPFQLDPSGFYGFLGICSMCHRPWGSICAGAHVSCATGQESTVCLCMHLRSLLFDPSWPLFHVYHSIPIIDVARIHLIDCLVSIPLMGRFSVSTASLVLLYKGSPTCPVTASRVSCLLILLAIHCLLILYFLSQRQFPSIRPSDLAVEASLVYPHLYYTRLYATVATV
jgi:hypothetical protein